MRTRLVQHCYIRYERLNRQPPLSYPYRNIESFSNNVKCNHDDSRKPWSACSHYSHNGYSAYSIPPYPFQLLQVPVLQFPSFRLPTPTYLYSFPTRSIGVACSNTHHYNTDRFYFPTCSTCFWCNCSFFYSICSSVSYCHLPHDIYGTLPVRPPLFPPVVWKKVKWKSAVSRAFGLTTPYVHTMEQRKSITKGTFHKGGKEKSRNGGTTAASEIIHHYLRMHDTFGGWQSLFRWICKMVHHANRHNHARSSSIP